MKTKKRLLIDSWISALLCLIMIVGVTYAWFTAGNFVETDPIEAGMLQVGVVNSKGKSMEKKTLQWMTQNINHWEPGCTYYTEPFTIDNTGDLYFKYKLSIDGFAGDKDLLDVLEFHIYKYDTETKKVKTDKVYEGVEIEHKSLDKGESFVLAGTMSAKADNKYQGMKLNNATVVVNATQLAGDTYDKVVVNGEVNFGLDTHVSNFEELKTAVAAATEDNPVLITLEDNIDVTETLEINGPTYIYSFNDHVLTLSQTEVKKATLFNINGTGTLVMDGVQITENVSVDIDSIFITANGHLKLVNCEIKGVATKKPLIQAYKEADIIMTNTTIENNTCQAVIFDQKDSRKGTTTTRLQYCNINNNKITARAFQIHTDYSISGGTISGNTSRDGLFQVQGNDATLATVELRYVTMRGNETTSAQVAIAWVRDYAKMTINEGTLIEGNTASLSYGNIKVATKGILNINDGTIKPIGQDGNGFVDDIKETEDNYTGIVNDKATINIAKEAIVEGTNFGLDGYTSGSEWPKN